MENLSKETQNVYSSIEKFGPVRPSELVELIGISTKNVYKHLGRLLETNRVQKLGETPRVYYSVKDNIPKELNTFDSDDLLVEHNYIYVSPDGKMIRGMEGFEEWTRKNGFNLEKEKKAYIRSLGRLDRFIKNGLISGKGRIISGKRNLSLDEIFFSNFYTFDHFGKTKLGQLVYVGKNSQNKSLIYEIAGIVKPAVLNLIRKYKVKQIGYIPPTMDRKVQFVDVLADGLGLDLPEIKIGKVPSSTKVPQKSLRKLEDRIENASKTIAVDPSQKFASSVLLIDDAAGSGATLNETAKKIKTIAGSDTKVIGYAVVGSYKGFDVISEV